MTRATVIGRLVLRARFKADSARARRYRSRMGYGRPRAERAALARHLTTGARLVKRAARASAPASGHAAVH